jgi:hypothetical protein
MSSFSVAGERIYRWRRKSLWKIASLEHVCSIGAWGIRKYGIGKAWEASTSSGEGERARARGGEWERAARGY